MKKANDQEIIHRLHSGKTSKKYQGKEVIVMGGKIHLFPKDDKKAGEFLNELTKKYPKLTPTITFVPKPGTTYILLSAK